MRLQTCLSLALCCVVLACGDASVTQRPVTSQRASAAADAESVGIVAITLERSFSGGYGSGRFGERLVVVLDGELEYEGSGDLPEDGSIREHLLGHSRTGRFRASTENGWIRSELRRLQRFVLDHLDTLRGAPWVPEAEHEIAEHSITDSVTIELSTGELVSFDIQDAVGDADPSAWALVRLLRSIDGIVDWQPR